MKHLSEALFWDITNGVRYWHNRTPLLFQLVKTDLFDCDTPFTVRIGIRFAHFAVQIFGNIID